MKARHPNGDLIATTFLILRNEFFLKGTKPKSYSLRDKGNVQDDPFDEHVCRILTRDLPGDAICEKATGPLITPDIAVYRPHLCNGAPRSSLTRDLTRIFGLEVKKLERQRGGAVARASGLDYNTTPPCGTVRTYDKGGTPLDIPGAYLFVCQERNRESGSYNLSALVLCDGDLLNADFKYYLDLSGQAPRRGKWN